MSPLAMPHEPWVDLLALDPRPWLLESDEPSARYLALTGLIGIPESDPEAERARKKVVSDEHTTGLVNRIPDWERTPVTGGHNSTSFTPNLLGLLADMGLRGGDSKRIDMTLDAMLRHQDDSGHFQTLGRWRSQPEPGWGSLLCDTHAITEILIRFGRQDDPRVVRSLSSMTSDLVETAQGLGWPCIADPVTGFRGPGRKADICPQVTLEALRIFARLPSSCRPPDIEAVARTSLGLWRRRADEKPYLFGHGKVFKTIKWPTQWYDIHMVLDTLGRYPSLWEGQTSLPEYRTAMAELLACLVAYNFRSDGLVAPLSCYKGFEDCSFGQKKQPSPFATARLSIILRSLSGLAEEARSIDVRALSSSKGGTGIPVPPKFG
jgi:hypothetical protein